MEAPTKPAAKSTKSGKAQQSDSPPASQAAATGPPPSPVEPISPGNRSPQGGAEPAKPAAAPPEVGAQAPATPSLAAATGQAHPDKGANRAGLETTTQPSKPVAARVIKKNGLPLFTLGCWLSATNLLKLCDPKRFDPAWLLLSELPSRRTFTRWTLAHLKTWILEQFGVDLSQESIRQALHRLGLSWKKARKLLAKADTQQRQAFLSELPALLAAAQQGQLNLIYIDEAHIHLDTDLGYGWAEQGRPFFVHSTSPGKQKVSLYGLYLYGYQSVRIWPAPSANGDYTIAVLERLRQQFPDGPIAIIWDGASYHRSQQIQAAAERLGIRLIKLPAYSPDFMPVEALWRWLREVLTAHHCHDSVAELIQRAADFAAALNLDPSTLADRLLVRSHLDPIEENLRL